MGVKSCLTKGEMTKVNKVVDKRKPATRKDQRFATKQEAIFGKVMADKKFIAEIDKLSTKRLRITAIQDELAKRGAKTSRAKLKRMLKEGIEIPKTVKPIIEPKIPVGKPVLTAITPGSPATPMTIMDQYQASRNAVNPAGVDAMTLKKQVIRTLGEKMRHLKMPEWDDFVRFELELEKGIELTAYHHKLASRGIIHNWAFTSGDNNPGSIAMQLAAKAEFNLKGTSVWWKKRALKKATTIFNTHEVAMRRFIREMHNNTQKYLKSKGLKSIRVVRGYTGDIGMKISTPLTPMAKVKIKLQPMSSFSSKFSIAENFAKESLKSESIIFAEVPASRVLSCPVTGFGCKNEFEWVVLGSLKEAETMLASRIGGHLGRWNYIFPGRSWIKKAIDTISEITKK